MGVAEEDELPFALEIGVADRLAVLIGFTLPRIAAVEPIAFIERPAVRLALAMAALPSPPIGPAQARAPPEAA
jgi:hypothetical protein